MVNQGWIEGYLDGIKKIAETIDREAIGRAVEMVWGAWQRGNTIFTCGNGGSAGEGPPPGGAMKDLADVCVVVPYNTTPHVESFHVVLHHLVTFCLADRIRASAEQKATHAAGRVPR